MLWSLFIAGGQIQACSGQPACIAVARQTDRSGESTGALSEIDPGKSATVFEFDKHGGVVYRRGEEFELTCDVYVPQGEGKFPALLAIHGGGWAWGTKLQWFRHARKLARSGYVVVVINYRHAPTYKFPAQIHDCKAAVRWMRKNAEKYQIDVHRVGGIGYSAGGHLAALLGTTDANDGLEGDVPEDERKISTRLQAVVAGGAPCEFSWIEDDSRSLVYWLGETRSQNPQVYRTASPANYISEDDPPFAFYVGAKDSVVPPISSETMHQQLLDQGLHSRRKVWRHHGHINAFMDLTTIDFAVEFFDQHLKK